MRLNGALLLAGCALPAHAHVATNAGPGPDAFSAGVGAAVLVAVWLAYLAGARRRPPPARAARCFHAAQLAVLFAAFGPVDSGAAGNVALHMAQHMGFMLLAAPLWVLANPLPQLRALGGGRPAALWRGLARVGHAPAAWALLHGAVIWFWHAPGPYRLALADPWWHLIEHASFLLTAVLFWAAVLNAYPPARATALAAVAVTLMHTGLLGALLTLAPLPLYGGALEHQQLAGLLMWGPGGLCYLAAAVCIALRWMSPQRRSQRS